MVFSVNGNVYDMIQNNFTGLAVDVVSCFGSACWLYTEFFMCSLSLRFPNNECSKSPSWCCFTLVNICCWLWCAWVYEFLHTFDRIPLLFLFILVLLLCLAMRTAECDDSVYVLWFKIIRFWCGIQWEKELAKTNVYPPKCKFRL